MTLSLALPVVSANLRFSSAFAKSSFWSWVILSTNAFLAAANAAFFSVTVCNAAFTASCVAFGFESTASAAFTASSAACFAVLYDPTVSGVFPAVTSSATASFSSFLAVSSADVLALSFNNVAASANFALIALTFAWASIAASLLAFSPLAAIASAACFAAVSSPFNSCNLAS